MSGYPLREEISSSNLVQLDLRWEWMINLNIVDYWFSKTQFFIDNYHITDLLK